MKATVLNLFEEEVYVYPNGTGFYVTDDGKTQTLALSTDDYRYTHGGKTYQAICESVWEYLDYCRSLEQELSGE